MKGESRCKNEHTRSESVSMENKRSCVQFVNIPGKKPSWMVPFY